jgi:hypothetical protein
MKLAIRTLAALLALSSTAVAEDWSGTALAQLQPITYSQPGFETQESYTGTNYSYVTYSRATCNPNENEYTQPPTGPCTNFLSYSLSDDPAETLTIARLPQGLSSSLFISFYPAYFSDPNSPSGVSRFYGALPLSAFARSDTVSAMAANVAALEQRILSLETAPVLFEELDTKLQDARRQADEGSAMAAAMTTVAPADGKANRIGFNTATYNGSTAVAVSYSRAAGDVDFNVGVAMAGDNAMVKAGAGFSW